MQIEGYSRCGAARESARVVSNGCGAVRSGFCDLVQKEAGMLLEVDCKQKMQMHRNSLVASQASLIASK